MRNVQLHPFSVLTGGVLAILAFVTMGQKPIQSAEPLPKCPGGEAAVRPSDFVQIRGDQTYVVPSGKDLIFTAVRGEEGISGATTPQIHVDGVPVAGMGTQLYGEMERFPAGNIFAPSGSTVTWWTGTPSFPDADKIWIMGYLADNSTRDRVVIKDSDPAFVVPVGRVFIPTLLIGLDVSNLSPWAAGSTVRAAPKMVVDGTQLQPGSNTHFVFPKYGLAIEEGSVIELQPTSAVLPGQGRLWGYLVDA